MSEPSPSGNEGETRSVIQVSDLLYNIIIVVNNMAVKCDIL